MKVRYTRRAIRQLMAICLYIEKGSPAGARRVSDGIEDTIRLLTLFPYSGRKGVRPKTRERRVPNLRYVVVYRVESEDTVVIIAVYHTSQRRPGQRL